MTDYLHQPVNPSVKVSKQATGQGKIQQNAKIRQEKQSSRFCINHQKLVVIQGLQFQAFQGQHSCQDFIFEPILNVLTTPYCFIATKLDVNLINFAIAQGDLEFPKQPMQWLLENKCTQDFLPVIPNNYLTTISKYASNATPYNKNSRP